MSAEYRHDIDGLRAIAVVSVVLFHVFPQSMHGGFVGVDIFFVISGFLISGLIYEGLRRGSFSYLDFYARRARRIFPALGVVLAASLVCGFFLLLPDEFRELGKETLAGAGFAANLLFWNEAGYFDNLPGLKPLLHLWSLGVEEQFYLLWPLIVALFFRAGRTLMPLIIIGIASLVANIVLTANAPDAAFYLPLTRFWELLSGAALAACLVFYPDSTLAKLMCRDGTAGTPRSLHRWAPDLLAAAGVILLILSLWKIDSGRAFPGWWALLPAAAASAMVLARRSWLNTKILSSRVFVFVGVISYPLYLWHWVILIFMRQAGGNVELDRLHRLSAIALSVALAWSTYEFIEKPIRFGALRARRPTLLAAALALIGAVGLLVYMSDGDARRYPAQIRALAAYDYYGERRHYTADYRLDRCFLQGVQAFSRIAPECFGGPDNGKPLIVLWGDSHAASLYPGLLARERSTGAFRLAQFTAGGCPPVLGMDVPHHADCKPFNDAVLATIRSLRPQTLIMEGDWRLYTKEHGRGELDAAVLRRTMQAVREADAQRVVVFGDLPVWTTLQPRVGILLWLQHHVLTDRTALYLNSAPARVNPLVRQAADEAGMRFVSPLDLLCNREGCLLSLDPQGAVPIAWDAAHLTDAGSALIVRLAAPEIFGTESQTPLL